LAKAAPKKKVREVTVDELKAGKPLIVYTFVECTDPTEDCYKFSRKFEMNCLNQKSVEHINAKWRATKRTVDIDGDRAQEKYQTKLEFYSFTGKLLDKITVKDMGRDLDGSSGFFVKLNQLEKQNRALCEAEIKRIQAEQEKQKAAEAEKSAAK